MKFSPILSVFLATLASVSPAAAQSSTRCGNFDSISRGIYTVYNLVFGFPSSGSQCITANSLLNLVLNWSVEWTFAADGEDPISFPNAGVSFSPRSISNIVTFLSTWNWRQVTFGIYFCS